jgi:PTH1 family peptidyl-tRNA hydrolase
MQIVVAGLGNPGEEYIGTRHNVGRDMLMYIAEKEGDKRTLFGKKATILFPDTYMNNSGKDIKAVVKNIKAAEGLVVVHDEVDLPLGKVKISFGSGPGGHNGVKSVQAAVKTKDFTRIRIGISPSTPMGKLKKPDGSVLADFVLGTFKPTEQETLKKVRKTVSEALELILTEGRDAAMTVINSK